MKDYTLAPFAGKKFKNRLTLPEVSTILAYYHFSGYADFKAYYENQVLAHTRRESPIRCHTTVSSSFCPVACLCSGGSGRRT